VIAKQERVRLSERTIAGLQRARARGRIGGRPRATCDASEVRQLKADGETIAEIALTLKVSKSTVYRSLQQSGRKGARASAPVGASRNNLAKRAWLFSKPARKTCDCRPLKPSSVNAGNSRLLDREFGWEFSSPLWNRHYFLFADEPPEGLSQYFPTSPFERSRFAADAIACPKETTSEI